MSCIVLSMFVCASALIVIWVFLCIASFVFVVFPMLGVLSGDMLSWQVDVLSYEVRCLSR